MDSPAVERTQDGHGRIRMGKGPILDINFQFGLESGVENFDFNKIQFCIYEVTIFVC